MISVEKTRVFVSEGMRPSADWPKDAVYQHREGSAREEI